MNLKPIISLLNVQFLSSLRSFASVFYTLFLPGFLFVIFGLVFRVTGEYAVFFLPGMIGVMVSSDAMFATGPVVKQYYVLGIVREFRSYPIATAWLFVTFVLVRLVFVTIAALILIAISSFLFSYIPDPPVIVRYTIGVILCYSIYSFIALSVSFFGIVDNRDQGILSVYYFGGMFLADAYIALSRSSPILDLVGYIFPLKVVLKYMRGSDLDLLYLFVWLAVSVVLLIAVLSARKSTRV